MLNPLFIHWNPDPEVINLFGISIRYYGLLWIIGLACAYLTVRQIYRDRRLTEESFDPLFFYCFFGILIGARLGHCLFYDPTHYYISSMRGITEMLLPIQFQPDGGWKFTGYEGLASHGGTAGMMFTLWLYCRKMKMHYIDVVDMIAIATPITACFIRLANLMNSEIIGMPTQMPWGFVFERITHLNGHAIPVEPRHPAQLYEALAYLTLFIIMMVLYRSAMKKQGVEHPLRSAAVTVLGIPGKKQTAGQKQGSKQAPRTDFTTPSSVAANASKKATDHTASQPHVLDLGHHRGFYFGLCLAFIFTFRFFIEFLKENQGSFEDAMTLNMGQKLSIPFILIGLYFMFFYGKKKERI